MRATSDVPRLPAVMDAEGRLLPFDRGRLRASLVPALTHEGLRADDLAAVVAAWLARAEQPPVVGSSELAELATRVLVATGDRDGARRYRAGRSRRRGRAPAGSLDLDSLHGAPGPAAENRLAQLVLADRVVTAWLPGPVATAERAALLSLGPWIGGARLPAAALPESWLRQHRGPDLGASLRQLLGLVTDELYLPWTGRAPQPDEWLDLLRHLSGAPPARLVVGLPTAAFGPAGHLTRLLDGLASRPDALVTLRLVGRPPAAELAEGRLPEGTAGRVQWAAVAPEAGCVVGAAGLDLGRATVAVGRGGVPALLALAEELAGLALDALTSLAQAGFGAGACRDLGAHAGTARSWRLVLGGHAALERSLLARHASELGPDLLSALGERLARAVAGHGAALDRVELALSPTLAGVPDDPDLEPARRERLGVAPCTPHVLPSCVDVAAHLARLWASPSLTTGPRPCA